MRTALNCWFVLIIPILLGCTVGYTEKIVLRGDETHPSRVLIHVSWSEKNSWNKQWMKVGVDGRIVFAEILRFRPHSAHSGFGMLEVPVSLGDHTVSVQFRGQERRVVLALSRGEIRHCLIHLDPFEFHDLGTKPLLR